MLAVVWEVEHFHLYVYGSQFSVIVDHKPLIGILKNHKQTSLQTERWELRLMLYDCQLIYRPGRHAEKPADFMSQHPSFTVVEEPNLAEVYVSYMYPLLLYQKQCHSKKSNKKTNTMQKCKLSSKLKKLTGGVSHKSKTTRSSRNNYLCSMG